jgi:hypothetical protein
MAKNKDWIPPAKMPPSDDRMYREFMRQLLAKEITVVKLRESHQGNGQLKIKYDED